MGNNRRFKYWSDNTRFQEWLQFGNCYFHSLFDWTKPRSNSNPRVSLRDHPATIHYHNLADHNLQTETTQDTQASNHIRRLIILHCWKQYFFRKTANQHKYNSWNPLWKTILVGPPGFEPESRESKSQSLDQASRRPPLCENRETTRFCNLVSLWWTPISYKTLCSIGKVPFIECCLWPPAYLFQHDKEFHVVKKSWHKMHYFFLFSQKTFTKNLLG